MSDFGEMINTLMKNKRVSIKKLSEMSGLSASQLSRMEAGSKFNSGASGAVKVAKALGVSVDDILGDNQNKSVSIEASEQDNKKSGRTTFAVSMVEKTKLEVLATKLEGRVGCKVRWTDILHRMIDDIDLIKAVHIFTEYVDSSKE
ncbi:XRE family transcriptional regulator [Erwinia psidii]|uniref:helix-turn-helix domain-containing protein n=1 Tax=Erwinia psidii TaxID=69224 RepID=UPI00226BA9DA|nr:helix-turn-helix transcriptional regulator [Erwinia psidii]MCX8959317.1 XRE family transcriptional regulator [Erwinia psidii]MCX8962956.1 XRE family transcriptional regulator [Erwinia psidii]